MKDSHLRALGGGLEQALHHLDHMEGKITTGSRGTPSLHGPGDVRYAETPGVLPVVERERQLLPLL